MLQPAYCHYVIVTVTPLRADNCNENYVQSVSSRYLQRISAINGNNCNI